MKRRAHSDVLAAYHPLRRLIVLPCCLSAEAVAAVAEPAPVGYAPPVQGGPAAVHPAEQAVNAPNKILFLENVPAGTNEGMLSVLFTQYPGFVEVRRGRPVH